jgi:serine/threonine-protein kinase HipA
MAINQNTNPQLTIRYEGQTVGVLDYNLQTEFFNLNYADQWKIDGFAISPHLPLSGNFSQENTRKFLENLMPEGEAYKTLLRAFKIAPNNLFSMLSYIGPDATGAFSFETEVNSVKTSFRPVSEKELSMRIQDRSSKPISIWDGKPRLSLAGVQEKLAVTMKNSNFGFGEGELASTHILKFSQPDRHLVINEYFCMELAKKIKMPVASVELLKLHERVLLVKRFDREWSGLEKVKRKHIIDACQMLNCSPDFKYERVVPVGPEKDNYLGPVNVKNLVGLNQLCEVPALAQIQLLNWILFNLLIGNTDNHGKNLSFYLSKNGITMAPAYDLINISVYEDFNHELAFKIGDSFELNEVKAFQLAELSLDMNLSAGFMVKNLEKMCQEVLKNLTSIELESLAHEESLFLKKVIQNIKIRTQSFLKQSELIVSVSKKL